MNPGVTEEVGQTTRSFFEIMKSQPATLAMIVSNIALLVFIFYALTKAAEFRSNLISQQYEYQRQVTALLTRCVVPQDQMPRLQQLQKTEPGWKPAAEDKPYDKPKDGEK